MRALSALAIVLMVTGCDDQDKGTADSNNGANTPPVVGQVLLEPEPASELTTLICSPSGVVDDNGDDVDFIYGWQINTQQAPDVTETLTGAAFDRGDIVTCTITPDDGTDLGVPVPSNEVTIINTPPSGIAVVIDPALPLAADPLIATVSGWSDADGDPESWRYDWFIDGADAGAATEILDAGYSKGDDVFVIATPDDGIELGDPIQSDTITIGNTPPTLVQAEVTPLDPTVLDALICTPSGDFDEDGDFVGYVFEWFVDGLAAGSNTNQLLAPNFTSGNNVYCVITPTDGDDDGIPVQSNTVVVRNSAPTIDSVDLTPDPAFEGTTMVCNPVGLDDPDSDLLTLTFAWRVAGITVPVGTSSIDGAWFDKGDAVQCDVTANDGLVSSPTTPSNLVVISNTPPSATGVDIAPLTPYTNDNLMATGAGWSDVDGDPEDYQYEWTLNGVPLVGETNATLSNTLTAKDDTVSVAATPDDGDDLGLAVLSPDVLILNTPPATASVSLTPLLPLATDTLTCADAGTTDLDGDAVTVNFDWYVNLVLVTSGVSQINNTFFGTGQDVYCVATPNDGDDDGTPVQSNTVRIENTAPTITSVDLSPDPAFESDVMTCAEVGMIDPDGDPVTAVYSWTVGGLPIPPATSTINGVWFDKGDAIQCSVTPDDGANQGATVPSNIVIVGNTAPSATGVTISPDPAYTDDNVSASVSGWNDADGDAEDYLFQWSVNTIPLPGETSSSLTSANYIKGDAVSVTATPYDGTDFGLAVGSGDRVISNTPPTLVAANLSPISADATDTLTCTPLGPFDLDGDGVNYFYQWFVDGLDIGVSTPTLTTPFISRNNTVWCVVTPDDGTDPGNNVQSNVVVISNSAPTIASVALTPDPAYEGSVVTCAAVGDLDLDGDAVNFTYSWTVNAVGIPVIGDNINGVWFDKNDVVQCSIIPDDGMDSGPLVASNVVVVQNTAPSIGIASITPANPATDDDVMASVTGWSDVDGDSENYVYEWTVNGGVILAATGPVLTSSNYIKDDIIGLTVTPDDGTDLGTPVVAVDVVVVNTPPTLAAANLTPPSPTALDTLTCSPFGSSDDDGDVLSYVYEWFVEGLPVGTGLNTLAAPDFGNSDDVYCRVTPDDGTDLGPFVDSNQVNIGNLAPEIASVTLTPDPAYEGDILTCTANGVTDGDGDPVSLSYTWTVAGLPLPIVTDTLDSSWFDKNDAVQCLVTPNDGVSDGLTVLSNVIVISNTAPSAASVTLGPIPSYTNNNVVATVLGWADIDGDPEGYAYEWTVNGGVVGGALGPSLANLNYGKNDLVGVTATPDDGTDLGLPVVSVDLQISNTPPTLVGASVTPLNPDVTDTLTCAPLGPADLDLDVVSYVYQWYANALPVGIDANTLTAPDFASGMDVYCQITPDDGDDLGVGVPSNTVTIDNSAPSLVSVTLAPDPAFETSLLTCTGNTPSDPDGDQVFLSYEWSVNGFIVPIVSDTLDGAIWFDKNDAVQCIVTPDDGLLDGVAVVSNTVVISNTPPSATDVTLAPVAPFTDEDVTATVNRWVDVDSDLEGYLYAWEVNLGPVIGETAAILPSANYVRGDSIVVTATPHDGTDPGTPVISIAYLVQNSPPALVGASLSPTGPDDNDVLTCAPLGPSDADNDVVLYTYEWFVGGQLVVGETTANLTGADFDRGEDIYCEITPGDGTDDGAVVQSNTVTAINIVPVVATSTLAPDPAYESDTLTCTAGGVFDGDGDFVSLTYAWTVNGFGVAALSNTLDGASFNKNDAVQCLITPDDGVQAGLGVLSNVVVISNTPPSATSLDIAPLLPFTNQDVVGTVNGWNDDDNDAEDYIWEWRVNTFLVVGADTDTLSSADFVKGDSIEATAFPDDATDLGVPVVSVTTVAQNSLPILTSVNLTPVSPDILSILTCDPVVIDLDTDNVTYTYAWYVGGYIDLAQTTNTLQAPAFGAGQQIYCEVIPNDGEADGAMMQSNQVAVGNSAPTIGSVTLTPDPVYEGDVMTCAAGTVDDADGDPVTLIYSWTVGGLPVVPATNTLDSSHFARGQAVQCSVIPDDGLAQGSPVPSNVVIVSNTAPSATSAAITPDPAYTNNALTVAGSGWFDADGDTENYTYEWYVNLTQVAGEFTNTLASTNYLKNDTVSAIITPHDGIDPGVPVFSPDLIISNSLPTAPVVDVTPDPTDDDDTLVCSITTQSSDTDGDVVNYSYRWDVDGFDSGITTNTVSGVATALGELWECYALPNDGQNDGPEGTDLVVIDDLSAPNAPVLDAIDQFRNSTNVNVDGTAEANSTITLYATCDMGSSGSVQTAADPLGDFGFVWVMLAGETCSFQADSEDASGNISGLSNTVITTVCASPDLYEDLTPGYGNTNSDPIDEWGPLLDNGAATLLLEGNMIANDPDDWFVVYGDDDPATDHVSWSNNYNINITMTDDGGGIFKFLVYRSDVGIGDLECPAYLGIGYDDYNDYWYDSGDALNHPQASPTNRCRNNSRFFNECEDMGTPYYIQVIRSAVPDSCASYQISVTNGM